MNIQRAAVCSLVAVVFTATVGVSKPAIANTNSSAASTSVNIAAPVTNRIEAATKAKLPVIRVAPNCANCWMWHHPDNTDASPRNGA